MNNYLIVTALYRFICGGLILLINWELASPESTKHLAIATVLSFVPAIFTPFLIKLLFKNYTGSKLTKLSFLLIFLIVTGITTYYQSTFILIVLNFLLWIIFFLLETSLEFWFSELVENQSEIFINKYSSLSMTINQVALMIGPLFVSLIIKFIELQWIFLIYGLSYLLLYFAIKRSRQVTTNLSEEDATQTNEHIKILHYCISMLMWPILGTINFMLPTFTTFKNGKIYEVALLDSALGVGMAVIGVILSKWLSSRWLSVFLILTIGITLLWYLYEDNLYIKLFLMLVFGLAFGGARIMFRKMIVTTYTSQTVKRVYSLGNAFGLPVLALCIYLSILNLNFVWLPSFILLIVLLILLKTQHHERNITNEKSIN
ncbi:MFS transporter [Staphylococcus caeli]|uniref:MFS transporter n=1 Tax=Staphylococcus caeli TaxID=2201815 RepID=UPI003F55DFB0